MSDIVLSGSTGDSAVDSVVGGLLGIIVTAFPGRVRTCYVEGSYADHSEIRTSDVDLTIVFKDYWASDTERENAARLAGYCAAISRVELDINLADDASLAAGVYPSLKLVSLCLYGEDQRAQLPLLPIEEWTRERMHAAYWLLVTVFNRPQGVTLPLGYPDAADEFFGYARRTVRLPTGVEVPSTRDLIRVTGWIATALLALQAHVYVARKKECHDSYSHYIGGPWATLLHDIYHRLRTQWGYLIPAGSAERGELRALGEQTVRFENHFLVIYREYLLAQLDADGPTAPRRALWVLEHLPFRDAGVRLAVQRIARHHEDAELRGAAERVQALR